MALTSSSGEGSGGIADAERRLVVAEADMRRRQFEWDQARSHVKARFRERIRKPGTVAAAFFVGFLFGALRAPDLKRVSGITSLAVLLFKSRNVVRDIVSVVRRPSRRARAVRRLAATDSMTATNSIKSVDRARMALPQEVIVGQ